MAIASSCSLRIFAAEKGLRNNNQRQFVPGPYPECDELLTQGCGGRARLALKDWTPKATIELAELALLHLLAMPTPSHLSIRVLADRKWQVKEFAWRVYAKS